MCRLSPSCFEEQNQAEGPELWVQQVHASLWLDAQFFNQLRWAELFGIDDHPCSFSRDVYEALTSRAIPEKQNGRVIPDSEDESAFTFSRLWRTRWCRLHKANQSEASLLWAVSACNTGKNCSKKLLAIVLHFMIISLLRRSSAHNHHFTEEQELGFN